MNDLSRGDAVEHWTASRFGCARRRTGVSQRPFTKAARLLLVALGACAGRDETLVFGMNEPPAAGASVATNLGDDRALPPETRPLTLAEHRCDAGPTTRAGATPLSRSPYLQRATSTSIAILYAHQTNGTGTDRVEITEPNGSLVASVPAEIDPAAPGRLQRVAHVEGLKPLTDYCYSLNGLTGRSGFRTAPLPDTGAVVRFAVFGDSGNASVAQMSVRDQLEARPIDLLLHTGDIAYDAGSREQFEQSFFSIYQDILASVPMFPVPGNHEYGTDSAGPYLEVFDLPGNGVPGKDERWYSFDWGDVHFVGLDTEQVHAEQLAWLERDLATNQRPWTVVYLHKPPYSSGAHGGSPAVQETFVPAFERHGVSVVFTGHDHDYERTLPIGGVTYIVTGGGGKSLRSVGRSAFTAYSESVMHFVWVEVKSDRMRIRAISSSGEQIDSVDITRR
jgi:3',5'-cyclic AMP phosphodiesterase CpdA